ncbi:MAG TPA: ATP-binding protein, partial [Chitinophagales bacterium]|nr:ATP-binding protein [Chitinophagales bacterium]
TIADNGVGFDNKYNQQVFEMFRRLGNSATYRGSGMGLAICRRIVELHKGSISATSQEGVGTTITLKFRKREL